MAQEPKATAYRLLELAAETGLLTFIVDVDGQIIYRGKSPIDAWAALNDVEGECLVRFMRGDRTQMGWALVEAPGDLELHETLIDHSTRDVAFSELCDQAMRETDPVELEIQASFADADRLLGAIQAVRLYDPRLNAEERAPTGDDYNAIIALLGGGRVMGELLFILVLMPIAMPAVIFAAAAYRNR